LTLLLVSRGNPYLNGNKLLHVTESERVIKILKTWNLKPAWMGLTCVYRYVLTTKVFPPSQRKFVAIFSFLIGFLKKYCIILCFMTKRGDRQKIAKIANQ
jgi:hypothetical protein